MLTILIVTLTVIALILLIFVLFARKSYTKSDPHKLSSDLPEKFKAQNGGLLISMFSPQDAQKMLNNGAVSIWDFDQCAAFKRHSCAALSLVRSDLPPVAFITPNLGETVGFIFDLDKLESLITGMFVVDGDTNYRSYCTNETGYPLYVKESITSAKCEKDDDVCKFMNSGGGINGFYVEALEKENAMGLEGCYDSKQDGKAVLDPNCRLCTKPYICKFENPPIYGLNNNNTDIQHIQDTTYLEDDAIVTYIGKEGELWNSLYAKTPFDAVSASTKQCKFLKKDWDKWINVLKKFNKEMKKRLRPDGSSTDSGIGISPSNGYVLYLENEVNIYINPDKSDTEQNNIFVNSICGVFYVSNRCTDQIYHPRSKQICEEFYSGDNEKENLNIIEGKVYAQKLANLLRKQGRDVDIFEANLDSNMYPNYKRLQQLEEGEIPFDNVFKRLIIP